MSDADLNEFSEADPKRPFKVYVGVVSVFLSTLLTEPGADSMPLWLRAIIVSTVAGLAVFATPNPIVKRRRKSPRR